tara:strand:+ start:377 stop:478 length:102 start_codon:yes stop_codon:yes gene_type:complete
MFELKDALGEQLFETISITLVRPNPNPNQSAHG